MLRSTLKDENQIPTIPCLPETRIVKQYQDYKDINRLDFGPDFFDATKIEFGILFGLR